jgi:hypothetical protein
MTVELVRDGKPWWNDLTELASFGRWLTATGQAPRDIFEVVEKPWKWDDEHRSFLREEEMERLADEDEAFTELERRRGL